MSAELMTVPAGGRDHVLWDPTKADFEDDEDEVHISNNAVTVLPILVGNH